MSASFAATAAWGLVVLAAFVGWGGALGRFLFGDRRADAGLRAAWGMALAIAAGGFASLLTIASRPAVFVFVGAGVLLACIDLFRERPRLDFGAAARYCRQYPGSTLLLVLIVGAALVQYVASICNLRFNPNDDFIAYFPFARQILDQGTLFDPFSTRRVMSFGGHSLLQAIVLAGSAGFRLHLLDQGVCLLIAVMLIAGVRTDPRPRYAVILALMLLLTFPDIRINTYAQMSGVVIFFGLYRTMVWLDEDETRRPIASAAVLALVASAACTLRSNYIAVAVPMVALSYAHLVWRSDDRLRAVRETVYAAGFSLIFLFPWMASSYQSSGTPLFPLLQGHFNPAFPMLQSPGNWREQLSDLFATVTQNRLMPAFGIVFLGGFLLPDRGSRRPLHALLLSSLIGWALLVHTLASDIPSFERYVYGFLIAAVLAVTTRIGSPVTEPHRTRSLLIRTGRTIAAAGALAQLVYIAAPALGRHQRLLLEIDVVARLPIRSPDRLPVARSYRAVQARVPENEPLLVMADYPFLFDFTRNAVYNIDTAAAVSPPPGFPYFRGPEAIATYLRGQSIRYLAFVPPESALSLYRIEFWESQRDDPQGFWHEQAPLYLDLFANIADLAASRKHLYTDRNLVLLDLMQPRE